MSRRCSRCKVAQPLSNFGAHKQRKDGIALWCKRCCREHVKAYRETAHGGEKHRQSSRSYYERNRDRALQSAKIYRARNLDHARAVNNAARLRRMQSAEYRLKENKRVSEWAKANRARSNARARINRLRRIRATPAWLDAIQRAQIQEFYEIAAARSVQTGEKHHVDHIFAIKGQGWCGLHVPWNLQVLTAEHNDRKWIKVPKAFERMLWNEQKNLRSHCG
jgi:5-methylcytosine-specific restriction endonuclease McrA